MADLHNLVRWHRTNAGMSQADLACRVGVTRQAISLIEAGQTVPSTTVALRLAAAFGVSVETLFHETEAGPLVARVAPEDGVRVGERVVLARVGERLASHRALGLTGQRLDVLPATGAVVARSDGGTDASPAGWTDGQRGEATVMVKPAPGAALRIYGVIAGCDIGLGLLAAHVSGSSGRAQMVWRNADNRRSLGLLRRGLVHAAAVHGADGEDAQVLWAGDVRLGFAAWQSGWILRRGEGRSFAGAEDLASGRFRLVNRPRGAGARSLLDRLLCEASVPPRAIPGYEYLVDGHLQVADAVASGAAHVGIGMAGAARLAGLDFRPVRDEACDLVIPGELLQDETVLRMLDTLHSDAFRWDLERFGPYDASRTGRTIT